MTQTILEVRGLRKEFSGSGLGTKAIERVDLGVERHEFVVVVGPSGCGKTTLLTCMAGLAAPSDGQTLLRGYPVSAPPLGMAVVFQDYSRSLFPWLSVSGNVRLPLRRKAHVRDKDATARNALAAVGLERFARHYPWQLSGGMQQRVAIARALAYEPEVLLMDEPFASVDAQTRAELEDLVLRVSSAFGITVVMVTHDIDESVYMADRVIVLSPAPATIRDVVRVELPRPRDQVKTRETQEFARLRAQIYRTVTRRSSVGADRVSTTA